MIPQRLEYLVLIVFLIPLFLALYHRQFARLLRSKVFWSGFAIFVCFAITVESLALRRGWWQFNERKILGTTLEGIPLEEYAMFFGFYALVASHWERTLELD